MAITLSALLTKLTMLLKKLTDAFGVSGSELEITKLISSELDGLGELTLSPLGNLTLHIPGNGKKVLFAAHMDEIGIMARFIDDNGFIYFSAVGGLDVATILNSRIRFENGICGVVSASEKKEIKDLNEGRQVVINSFGIKEI